MATSPLSIRAAKAREVWRGVPFLGEPLVQFETYRGHPKGQIFLDVRHLGGPIFIDLGNAFLREPLVKPPNLRLYLELTGPILIDLGDQALWFRVLGKTNSDLGNHAWFRVGDLCLLGQDLCR